MESFVISYLYIAHNYIYVWGFYEEIPKENFPFGFLGKKQEEITHLNLKRKDFFFEKSKASFFRQ